MNTCETTNTNAATSCGCAAPEARTANAGAIFHPQCDVYEAGEQLVVVADMPGCTAEGIDVNFERGILTVRGRVADRQREQAAGERLLAEYAVGDYYRTFRVGVPVDASAIAAEYAGGVLTVRLPKHESARPRRIAVTSANG